MSVPNQFTKIETENLEIATEDMYKGKIIARVKTKHWENSLQKYKVTTKPIHHTRNATL